MKPEELPVYKESQRIIETVKKSQVVVLESPTGSGKTTQVPIILHKAGFTKEGVVGITQPRRIAAVSVSDYIAKQLNVKVSGFVGYKMRFEDRTSEETRLKIMTDGTLLQEFKSDPLLSRYKVIMVDEAHERSLNIDFILGLLKGIIEVRSDLKVIISSATINAALFSEYFDGCPVISIDSPVYPVKIIYDKPLSNQSEVYIEKVVTVVERSLNEGRRGHMLIFLPGERDIKECITQLAASSVGKRLYLLPLYGRLSKEEQNRVFDSSPFGKTKVIVSTNIAETSVTIDGIATVIDSGMVKLNYYSPSTFTSSLLEKPISRASANQRRGRAGRTGPGTCYRLYSREEFNSRPLFTTEEIYRTDLSEVVMRMAELEIKEFYRFDFISPPGRKGISGAIETLKLLEALSNDHQLTDIGKMMSLFPVLPRHSRIIVEGIRRYPSVIRETIIATAFLSTNSPFLLPQGEEMEARKAHLKFQDDWGDFVSYLKIFRAFCNSKKREGFCSSHYLDARIMFELVNIVEQLEEIVSSLEVPVTSGGKTEEFLKACAKGLIQFICVRSGRGIYRTLKAERIIIHPGSVMFRANLRFLMAGEIVKTSQTYARSVSPLQKEWLSDISPQLAKELTEGGKEPSKESRGRREDDSFRLTIGKELFPITIKKGGKLAKLEYNKLKTALDFYESDSEFPDFTTLRGVLLYNGIPVMEGAKVNLIMQIVWKIDFNRSSLNGIPKKQYRLTDEQECHALIEQTGNLMKVVISGKKRKKTAGFMALNSEEKGSFFFSKESHFQNALIVSLASIEELIDQLSDQIGPSEMKKLNKSYHNMNTLFML